MEENTQAKTEYITSSDLAEQTKIILDAIDGRFNKVDGRFNKVDDRFNKVDDRFNKVDIKLNNLKEELYHVRTELKGDIKDVRDELYRVRDELKTDINDTQTSIDGYVKAQEDFKQEFVIAKAEIKQMKQIFKEKLGVEIRAV